jgi:hypothetical protein
MTAVGAPRMRLRRIDNEPPMFGALIRERPSAVLMTRVSPNVKCFCAFEAKGWTNV